MVSCIVILILVSLRQATPPLLKHSPSPWEGNVLLRQFRPHDPTSDDPELILLDHGLYRELDDEFRCVENQHTYASKLSNSSFTQGSIIATCG